MIGGKYHKTKGLSVKLNSLSVLPSTTTGSTQTPSNGLASQRAIPWDRITPVSPSDLLELLSAKLQPDGATNQQSLNPYLLIDMRESTDFKTSHIHHSINLTFPDVWIKRFDKKIISNDWSIDRFLVLDESKQIYKEWNKDASQSRDAFKNYTVLIFDDKMERQDTTTDSWGFVNALADGQFGLIKQEGSSNLKGEPCSIAYLSGGFDAFESLQGASPFLTSSPIATERTEPGAVSMTPLSAIPKRLAAERGSGRLSLGGSDSNSTASSPGTNQDISPVGTPGSGPSPRKGKLSISISSPSNSVKQTKLDLDVVDSPSSIKSMNQIVPSAAVGVARLKLTRDAPASDQGLQPDASNLDSPTDNDEEPPSFSIVNTNIILGSDEIPLAKDAIDQFARLGVTHILNMAAEVKNSPIVMECKDLTLKWVPVLDQTEQDMKQALQDSIDFICKLFQIAVLFIYS